METSEISEHIVRVVRFLRSSKGWRSNQEVAVGAMVAPRTARQHTKRLADLGIVDQAEVFPSHRFRISPMAEKRNKAFCQRLAEAEAVFGLE